MSREQASAETTQTAAARGSTASGADAAAALPAPSDAGCTEAAPASKLHCELQRTDRIRIRAADAIAAGLRGVCYKLSSVEIADLQRAVTLGAGWRNSAYVVQGGWAAVMRELGWSQGTWATLTLQDGRVHSIQKRAGPADPAPSMSATPRSADSMSTEGRVSEHGQQQPQSAAAELRSDAMHTADAVTRPASELATQTAAVVDAAAHLGSMLFRVKRASMSRCAQRLPSRQAHAAFPGYSKVASDVSVPALRRSFTVSLGWSGSEARFVLGAGWAALVAAAGLQDGDRVRLSRTGDASFKLDTGLDAAGMAEQEAAADPQGAQLIGVLWSGRADNFHDWAFHESACCGVCTTLPSLLPLQYVRSRIEGCR